MILEIVFTCAFFAFIFLETIYIHQAANKEKLSLKEKTEIAFNLPFAILVMVGQLISSLLKQDKGKIKYFSCYFISNLTLIASVTLIWMINYKTRDIAMGFLAFLVFSFLSSLFLELLYRLNDGEL
jgi:uncharacterized membrane protein